MTRRERLENKLEKRQEWAVKAQARADSRFQTELRILDSLLRTQAPWWKLWWQLTKDPQTGAEYLIIGTAE